jgi:FkbM family methyltransferase
LVVQKGRFILIMGTLKNTIKEILKPFPRKHAKAILNNQLLTVVDAGAANGLIPHWQTIDGFATVYGFEPHPEACKKLQEKYNQSEYAQLYKAIPKGLSRNGGAATLYVLNQPTGSSLLPVDMESPDVHPDDSYIFPIKEISITTESLHAALQEEKVQQVDMIKLDIQGAELEVMMGMGENYLHQLICAEMEVGFKSIYKGAPRPNDVEAALNKYDFELFDLNLAHTPAKYKGDVNYYLKHILGVRPEKNRINGLLVECDMIFFKKPATILQRGDAALVRRYITALCVYNFFTHALDMAQKATDHSIINATEQQEIIAAIKKWAALYRKLNHRNFLQEFYNALGNIKKHIRHGVWGRQ